MKRTFCQLDLVFLTEDSGREIESIEFLRPK